MRAAVALLVVLTAAGQSPAEAQADFYGRLGLTGATKLLKDDILQQIEVRQSLAPTLALGVSVPFTPLYGVGLEIDEATLLMFRPRHRRTSRRFSRRPA